MDQSMLKDWLASLQKWAETDLLTVSTGTQAACIAVAFVVAMLLAKPARRLYSKIFDWLPDRWRDAVTRQASELSLPIIWLLLQIGIFLVNLTQVTVV